MKLPSSQDQLYQEAFRQRLRLGHPNRSIGIAAAMICATLALIMLALVGHQIAAPPQQNAALQSKSSM
jgi:hypothetical protein